MDAIAAEKQRKADEEQRALQRRQEAEKAFADLRTQASLREDARHANAPEALAQSRKTHREKLRSLKSDLKKCTTLVRKVQLGITADDEAKLLNDIKALNLTRYVSELVDAVAETKKTKDKDAACAVAVCCGLHARHATFGPAVVAALESVAVGDDGFGGALSAPAGGDDAEAKELAKHRKGALKLLVELFLVDARMRRNPIKKFFKADVTVDVVFGVERVKDFISIHVVPAYSHRLKKVPEFVFIDVPAVVRIEYGEHLSHLSLFFVAMVRIWPHALCRPSR